ncbi:polyprenyl diphosphate synthase [Nocardia sp. NPDC003345]
MSIAETPEIGQASPPHVACVMDGNGRWALRRGLMRTEGHSAGETSIVATVNAALAAGTRWLTLYLFSSENWRRPQQEVDYMMRFSQRILRNNIDRWHARGVRIRYLGSDDPRIPNKVREDSLAAEAATIANEELNLTIAFGHGGRRDIVHAVKSLVATCPEPKEVTEETLAGHFEHPEIPDVDLFLRTSGEQRLSNFLLWHAAYAEFVFLDVLWPDFRAEHYNRALDIYQRRTRKFGTVDTVQADGRSNR